jgi:hypothetical protein
MQLIFIPPMQAIFQSPKGQVLVQFEERFVSGRRFGDAANGHNSKRL